MTDNNGFMYTFTGILIYDIGNAGKLRAGADDMVVIVFLLLPQDKKNKRARPGMRTRVIEVMQQISNFPR
jgi:hypothetical protein